jgi:hypothetical protein
MNICSFCDHDFGFHMSYDDLVERTQYHYSVCNKRSTGGCHKNTKEDTYEYKECSCRKVFKCVS